MRIEQSKLRQEVVEANKVSEEKEKEAKKLLNGAKREVGKMQSKIDMLKHEVKKWEQENFKLKQTLRLKLNHGQTADSSPQPQASAKSPLTKNRQNKLSAFVRASQQSAQHSQLQPQSSMLSTISEADEFY